MSLLVKRTADGSVSKTWSQRLIIRGKQVWRGFGSYPQVGLGKARDVAFDNYVEHRRGGDPFGLLRIAAPTLREAVGATITQKAPHWKNSEAEARTWRSSFENHVYPKLGDRGVDEITVKDLESLLNPLCAAMPATAKVVRERVSVVMRHAVAHGHRKDNPVEFVKDMLPKKNGVKHLDSVPHADVAGAVAAVRDSTAWKGTRLAFAFLVLTALRYKEVVHAHWSEIDLDTATWTVPAERMKMGREHRVPLSRQALTVLAEAKRLSMTRSGLVFPSMRGGPLNKNTLGQLMKRLGLAGTPHGFRASFSNWADESDVSREVSNRCTAHEERSATTRAYYRSDLLERRRKVMQRWGDYVGGGDSDA